MAKLWRTSRYPVVTAKVIDEAAKTLEFDWPKNVKVSNNSSVRVLALEKNPTRETMKFTYDSIHLPNTSGIGKQTIKLNRPLNRGLVYYVEIPTNRRQLKVPKFSDLFSAEKK